MGMRQSVSECEENRCSPKQQKAFNERTLWWKGHTVTRSGPFGEAFQTLRSESPDLIPFQSSAPTVLRFARAETCVD